MIFGAWIVRSLYRAGLLTAAARELTSRGLYFFYSKENENNQLGSVFFVRSPQNCIGSQESRIC
jgi:hypothetical protein